MNIQIISDLKEIARLKPRWNQLSADKPFSSWEWYHSWYANMSSARRVKPLVFIEQTAGGEVSTIAPFYLTRSKLGASRLCLAADGCACTDYGQIIAKPRQYSYSISKVASWLTTFNQSRANIDFIELGGLTADASTTLELHNRLVGCGFVPKHELLENCWATDLPTSWSELDATFSRKLRRKTKKSVDRLAECNILDSRSTGFDRLWASLVALHQMRRDAVGDSGCFSVPGFDGFLQSAARGLCERNLAEILVIEYQGLPIAATLVFTDRKTAYMYQTGFDPAFAHLEPGYLLIVAAMQWSIENGLDRFDFLRGNEPYKTRWNTTPVPMVRLRFQLSDNLRTRLDNRLQVSKSVLKSSLKRLGLLRSAG